MRPAPAAPRQAKPAAPQRVRSVAAQQARVRGFALDLNTGGPDPDAVNFARVA